MRDLYLDYVKISWTGISPEKTSKWSINTWKDVWPSPVIKELQMKTIIQYPISRSSIALILETDNNNSGAGCGNTGAFVHCWGGGDGSWYSHSGELWQFLKHFNGVAIWPRNSTPRYLHNLNENICLDKNRTQVFIPTTFIIAPKWKPPWCPSTGEKINTRQNI